MARRRGPWSPILLNLPLQPNIIQCYYDRTEVTVVKAKITKILMIYSNCLYVIIIPDQHQRILSF